MSLFTAEIENWNDWSRIFQSIPTFAKLAEHILKKERLPAMQIENLTPGTNAVFKAGGYVVKIYAPPESGANQAPDLQTEMFATRRAGRLGIPAPKLIADGFIEDKYRFAYMITEYIDGKEFARTVKKMTGGEKTVFGRKLRDICDLMNTPCEPFNGIDVINDKDRYIRWGKYPERFKKERLAYIKSHGYGENVFVHGDLCGDNILLSPDGGLYLIDFADAVLAPVIYEHAHIAVELFNFEPSLLRGFFGDYPADELAGICFNGLLIHDFGGDIVMRHIGKPDEFQCLDDLRRRLEQIIPKG